MGISQGTGAPKFSPFYGGQGRHKYITGCYYQLQGYGNPNQISMTVTATRVYYMPFAVEVARTFAGASIRNNDASANGQKCRVMVFADDGAIGGPGTLVKSFGEATFDATAKENLLSSAWTANPGLYWIATWFDSATVMCGMYGFTVATAVGGAMGQALSHIVGNFNFPDSSSNQFQAHRVDTTYGAAPFTAVAPTATINAGPFSTTPLVPLVALKA